MSHADRHHCESNPYYAFLAIMRDLDRIQQRLDRIEQKETVIMAMTQGEQEALDGLVKAVGVLTTDVDAAFAAATATNAALRDQIDKLTALRDQLQATNTADEAQIAILTTAIADLQQTLSSQESSVVAGLSGVTDQLAELDGHVKTLTP
jgi:chromosome segregation ATPase